MGDVVDHRTWHIFRRRHAHGLCCAIPSDAPLPTFLLTGDWSFALRFTRGDTPVPGFSLPSAEIGARYNGFYLFLGFGHRLSGTGPASFPPDAAVVGEPNKDLAHSPAADTRPV